MRHILLFFVFAGFFLANCSPSAEEKATEQGKLQAIQADSVMKAQEEAQSSKKEASLATNVDLKTHEPADKKMIKTADIKFKVNNVVYSTEKIEELTVKYGGYMVLSDLRNDNVSIKSSRISRDSILISKQIEVVNHLKLRVPKARLDSFIRELSPLVVYFDYRVIQLSDATFQFISNQKRSNRLQKYDQRQTNHIDQKDSKLKETSAAEEGLLDRQNQADDLEVKSLELEDQVKYCNLTMEIYQKPLVIKEVIADFESASEAKIGFFTRAWESVHQGWTILEETILFFIKLWSLLVLALASYFIYKYVVALYRKIKRKKDF